MIQPKRDVEPEQAFAMHDFLHDLAQIVAGNEVERRKLEMTFDLSEARMEKKFDWSQYSSIPLKCTNSGGPLLSFIINL